MMQKSNDVTMRKVLPFFALTIGVGLAVWLVIAANFTAVVHSFAQIGWGIAAIILVRAVMIMMNGVAWGELLATSTNAPFVVFPLLRWVREAIDVLLPVGSIGGSLVCARLLTFWRVSSTIAVAGVVVDVFLQTVAQIMFAGIGALLLTKNAGLSAVLTEFILGLAVAVIAVSGFYIALRYGGARLIDRLLKYLSQRTALQTREDEPSFQTAINGIWQGRGRYVGAALFTHLFAWMIGTLEVWLTLHFMEWPISLQQAIVFESLGASISTAAFLVPGSWGVQEGGYILIGQILGVPAYLSLTLSLVKRIPDLLLGAPGLLVWRVIEARHLFSPDLQAN